VCVSSDLVWRTVLVSFFTGVFQQGGGREEFSNAMRCNTFLPEWPRGCLSLMYKIKIFEGVTPVFFLQEGCSPTKQRFASHRGGTKNQLTSDKNQLTSGKDQLTGSRDQLSGGEVQPKITAFYTLQKF
jgi:hypothetical protein